MIRLRADLPEHMRGWEGQEGLWKGYYDHNWIPEMELSENVLGDLPVYIAESIREDSFSGNQSMMLSTCIQESMKYMPAHIPDTTIGVLSDLVGWLDYWGRRGYSIEAYE